MVEMSETAQIIRHATERSLILLDEVGQRNFYLRWIEYCLVFGGILT